MRILQIIDTLQGGGAERMAVNYANALCQKIEFSAIISTRDKGPLEYQIDKKVKYLFINKKRIFDLKAFFSLRKFVKQNKIDVIHAHSTSFFLVFLLKLSCINLKLIWHDHYGDSEFLKLRPSIILKIIIPFFDGVIAVNKNLENWALKSLRAKNVIYLPNFPTSETDNEIKTILSGQNKKRIICLANLRPQKNHFFLLEVAQKLKISHPEWTTHLVGKDFCDDYSREINNLIVKLSLQKKVFLYDSKSDIKNILSQIDIGILTSSSEGLPLAVLEYGLHRKAVVVTNVGQMSSIIENYNNGFIVESNNEMGFYSALVKLINDEKLRNSFGLELYQTVIKNYSEQAIIEHYLTWIKTTIA